MIEIDGRTGEGGGQILRTSLSLSALTNKPFTITNIRGNRSKPGLRAQHLAAVKLAASLCDAELSQVEVGSDTLVFRPKALRGGLHEVDIQTAGALPLLTQAALLPALFAPEPVELLLTGGTDVSLAPSLDYIRFVVLPYYRSLGDIQLQIERRGFFPVGQGRVRISVGQPSNCRQPLILQAGSSNLESSGRVVAATELQGAKVCERICEEVERILRFRPRFRYVESHSVNVALTLFGEIGNIRLGACGLGRKRLSSEKLAQRVCQEYAQRAELCSFVEENLADQLIPILALRGGEMNCQTVSLHCSTNMEICHLFTKTEFDLKGSKITAKVCPA